MTSQMSPSMPMRVRKPDSPSPDGTRACRLGLVQWSASLTRMGAVPKGQRGLLLSMAGGRR
jgi:hypothetical protein